MDNTRTVTDAKQQKIKIKKDVITSSMSTIVDRTCCFFYLRNRSMSGLGMLGYITVTEPKERSPEVCQMLPEHPVYVSCFGR
jgi:hypothetical protein